MKNAFREDVVGFKRNFDLWRTKENIDLLLLRDDQIWSKKEKIENHIGITVSLPEKRERKLGVKEIDSDRKVEEMRRTYGDMHKIVQDNKFFDRRR